VFSFDLHKKSPGFRPGLFVPILLVFLRVFEICVWCVFLCENVVIV